ncbi:MAG TPA: D-alanine--D-alanine ligase [Planctomycetota bacterium]|nr:D-alanine--D-alanine ligase [Planctomycetota bacterium]
MRVAVLHDLLPDEARPDEEDTVAQAEFVAEELKTSGHAVELVPFGLDLDKAGRALEAAKPDLVFNLVESVGGKARLLHLAPALLDAMGLRYTGCRTEALFLTTNKVVAKRMLALRGLPTAAWVTIDDLESSARIAGGRWIVKSVHEEASLGLGDDAVVEACGPKLLEILAERAPRLGDEAFAEAYVEGREFNLSLLATENCVQVLPAAETLFVDYAPGKPRIVGYAAKWQEDSYEYNHTPRKFGAEKSEPLLARMLQDLARQCWMLFKLEGYARVDFRVDEWSRPWILEVNANPCLSPDAGFMAAAKQSGLSVSDVLRRIVEAGGPGGR